MSSTTSSSFCVVPWLHRLVDERGFIKVCCVAKGQGNFLTDDRGARLHIQGGASEEAIFNSERLKELRRTMLAGEWDAICEGCLSAERAGGSSSRTGRNHRFRHRLAELVAQTSPDGGLRNPSLRHLDLRLGNTCNLTCRMCSPGASKLWTDSYNRVQPERYRLTTDRLLALKKVDWVDDAGVWARFADALPSIEWLHFAGGEPMMIPEMLTILRMCVAGGYAEQIELGYTTNATVLPGAVAELWPRFKSVALNCSIDGYRELNEYIRRPSRWRDVDRILHTLDTNFGAWNLLEVAVTCTVQVYNVLDLDKLYRYLRSEFTHVLPAPILNPLSWPAYLSVQHLPTAVKEAARERLLLEKARVEYQRDDLGWLISSIDTILAHLDRSANDADWNDFVSFTESSEREFRDSLSAAAPDLVTRLAGTRA